MSLRVYIKFLSVAACVTLAMVWYVSFKLERFTAKIEAEEAAFEQEQAAYWQDLAEKEARISAYLKKNGSIYYKDIARAVILTDKPELLAAIALKESTGNPYAVGDKGLSKGAWQVQEKWWGKVPTDTFLQAAQASKVIDTLLMRHNGNLAKALTDYNNANSLKYANSVIAHTLKMK